MPPRKPISAVEVSLWAAYQADPSEANRNALAEHYLPLVKMSAAKLCETLPSCIDVDDMVQAGFFGLLSAIAKFEPDRGYKFETYSATRIRGSMLDELRCADWVPRGVRRDAARVKNAMDKLQSKLARDPDARELAEALEVDITALPKIMRSAEPIGVVSIDTGGRAGICMDGEWDGLSGMDDASVFVMRHTESDAGKSHAAADTFRIAMRSLNNSERLLMVGYYLMDHTMREVGESLNLSESRISQMHKQIIERLRQDKVRLKEKLA